MESYKHSCPFCGQHIEYTLEYCGQQMGCPTCTKTVTFPAIPPGKGKGPITPRVRALDAQRAAAQTRQNWLGKIAEALGILRGFEHWNVVWQCTVPFLVIGVLLWGAIFVNKKFGSSSDPVAAPAVQADPEAWQKIADMAKAERRVKDLVQEYKADQARLSSAQQTHQQLEKGDAYLKNNAEEQVKMAQEALAAAHKRLDAAMEKYHQLGGTVDYRSQLHNY
jgi:hypothetical protein